MEKMEILRETIGSETLLNELLKALSEKECNENADFIARNWDIEL